MSQVLCPKLPLNEFDLRSSRPWFEHTQFRNFLAMALVLAFLKILYGVGNDHGVSTSTDITNLKTLITLQSVAF